MRCLTILLAAACFALSVLPSYSSNSLEEKTLGWLGPGEEEMAEVSSGRVSRRRRYLNFPDGSTVNVVLCLTISPIMPRNWYTFGLTAGMGFPLPNSTVSLLAEYSPLAFSQRRDRRNLYARIEELMESHGLDGRTCLYRLLCEVSSLPERPKGSFLEELLRILFTSPVGDEAILLAEMGEHLNYDEANRMGRKARRRRVRSRRRSGEEEEGCSTRYTNCPYSILRLVLADFAGIDDYIPSALS